jgi:hypothetical protein
MVVVEKKPQQFVVVGALAVVNDVDGKPVYVYRDSLVPSNADPKHVEHLVSVGLVKPVE